MLADICRIASSSRRWRNSHQWVVLLGVVVACVIWIAGQGRDLWDTDDPDWDLAWIIYLIGSSVLLAIVIPVVMLVLMFRKSRVLLEPISLPRRPSSLTLSLGLLWDRLLCCLALSGLIFFPLFFTLFRFTHSWYWPRLGEPWAAYFKIAAIPVILVLLMMALCSILNHFVLTRWYMEIIKQQGEEHDRNPAGT